MKKKSGESIMMIQVIDIVMGETREKVVQTNKKLNIASMSMRFCINENKIRYMVISRNNFSINDLLVGNLKSEQRTTLST